jgi:ubiquinone/menaquinone biosynthesis C-methylase UbiE
MDTWWALPVVTNAFDAEQYKTTTRAQWQAVAEAWDRWEPTIDEWLAEATETMLDRAHVGTGSRVLDVAAGAGGQTLAAARRVGPTGRVLATDLSPAILAYADARLRAAGHTNVETVEMDGDHLDVPPGSFDAVISRVGLIYFPDRQGALTSMLRALAPGGRIAAVTYSTPERNGFFSIPVSVIRAHAELPPPLPGQPGPFSLGTQEVAEKALRDAGFVDVESVLVPSPLRLPTAADCLLFEQDSFGALHQMLSGLDQAGRDAAWAEIGARLREFETPEGFVGPCEMLVVGGSKPQDAA